MDNDDDIARVRPPWFAPTVAVAASVATETAKKPSVSASIDAFHEAREKDRERRASVWPLLPPQDCLISHLQLKTILHEIARRNGLTEIDKDIYNVLQYSLFHRVRGVLEELAAAARHRRCNDAEHEEPGIRRIPTSNPDAVISAWSRDVSRKQIENIRRLEAEEARRKEEEDAADSWEEDEGEEEEEYYFEEEKDDERSHHKRKRFVRRSKKKKPRISRRERIDPVVEHARANVAAARMLFSVGASLQQPQKQQQRQQQIEERKPSEVSPTQVLLTPQQIAESLASIEARVKAIEDRLASISWDYKSARQLRVLTDSQLSRPLNDVDRKTLQELNWKREAHEKLSAKLRELQTHRQTFLPRVSQTLSSLPAASSSSLVLLPPVATRQDHRQTLLFSKTDVSQPNATTLFALKERIHRPAENRATNMITMADALACKSLIGATVVERYELRRCQRIQERNEKERQEKSALLPSVTLRKQGYK